MVLHIYQAKGEKRLDLKCHKGVWDGKWECVMAFTILMWTKNSFVLYFNIGRKNTKDTSIVRRFI